MRPPRLAESVPIPEWHQGGASSARLLQAALLAPIALCTNWNAFAALNAREQGREILMARPYHRVRIVSELFEHSSDTAQGNGDYRP